MLGCGGGGSTGGGGADLGLYITDDLNTGFDHVWVKVEHVSLTGQFGQVTVFDDPAGVPVDLLSLHDSGGPLFLFLTGRAIPTQVFTSVQVTLDKDVVLFPTGATTGQNDVFDSSGPTSKTFDIPITGQRFSPGKQAMVLDFDLSQWTVANGIVTVPQSGLTKRDDHPSLHDLHRHHRGEYHGTISTLAGVAPDQTFTLKFGSGQVSVAVDSTTVIIDGNGGNPVLSNNQRVEVEGVVDPATQVLQAFKVRIDDADEDQEQDVLGTASNANSGAGTFDVSVDQARGFVPDEATAHVTTSSNTVFLSHHGIVLSATDFFALLGSETPQSVEVEGLYDAASNTIAAQRIHIETEGDDNDGVEIRGGVSSFDASAHTLAIAPTEWEGFLFQGLDPIQVTTQTGTHYRVGDADSTQDTFFAALTAGATVRAEGTFDSSARTLAATDLRIDTGGGGH